MTEYDLQYQIITSYRNGLRIPNIDNIYGEMDVLRLTRNGYTYEYEIKLTLADFKADFKKQRKHAAYLQAFYTRTTKLPIPNYFTYVAPPKIIDIKEVPIYAGVYEIQNELVCVKKPPLIHRQKMEEYWLKKIAQSLNIRYLYNYWYKLKND